MTHFPAFRVKIIDKVRVTSEEERKKILRDCNYNLFGIKAKDVMLDFLTDSGTGALSAEQAAAMQLGDESYAGSESWFKFEKSVRYLFDFKYIIPTHQGRAAERILFTAVGGKGKIIPNNTHFDTTRANVECTGAKAIDLPIKEGKETHRIHPFKGNMDIKGLQKLLQEKSDKVPLVIVTITNNSGGGQPVSMENLYSVRAVCQKYGIPVFLDACRYVFL